MVGFVTITTIGFGDRFPVTADGRLIAVGLAVAGVSLIGLVTVTMGTWVMATLQKIRAEELDEEEDDDLELELIKVQARGEELALELNRNVEREAELEGILAARRADATASL